MTAQQRAVESSFAGESVGDSLGAASLLNVRIRRERPVNGGWQQIEMTDRQIEPPLPASLMPAAFSPPEDQTNDTDPIGNGPGKARDLSQGESREDLFDYWRDRLDGRRFPSWSDFESEEVLDRWPNTVLLACDCERRGPRLSAAFVEALRAAKQKDAEQLRPTVDYSPQLTEWLLALGREVARIGKPIKDSELLPGLKGRVPYRVVALPLGETPFTVDHVLCHVSRE